MILRPHDAGRRVAARVGDEVRFVLPAYLGTGFRWRLRDGTGYRLAAPIEIGVDPADRRRDATIVTVAFTRAGPVRVDLAAVPGGAGGGAASNELRFRFVVRE